MAAKRKAKKRRIRSPHPGVKLKRRKLPSGAFSWRAVYFDPDQGKVIYEKLDASLTTEDARELWAKNKSKHLARRRLDLQEGAHAVQSTDLAQAVEGFYTGAKNRLRPATITAYRLATGSLVDFLVRTGARKTGDLNRARLMAWRDTLIAAPHRSAKSGGDRGEYVDTDGKRRAATVNQRLRSVKTVLNHLRVAGRLRLTGDDIRDVLKPLRAPQEQPRYLKPAQLRTLLQSALRHDRKCYELTRDEKAGLRPPGTTERYVPIAEFVALAMLTGARRGELLALEWRDLDLEAVDAQGRAVGEFTVRAEVSKTHRSRVVGLDHAPQVRLILAKLQLRAGAKRSPRGRVFEDLTADSVEAARERLVGEFGAPVFSWQVLRSTASTFLVSAPNVFGAAAAFHAAKLLGHAVAVAEKHYTAQLRGLAREATTLPAAMQVDADLAGVLKAMDGPRPASISTEARA